MPLIGVKLKYSLLPLGIMVSLLASASSKEVEKMEPLTITSPAFQNFSFIPRRFTCDGADVSPPLAIAGVPEEARSLALIVDDPDAPVGTWVHWLVWNVSPSVTEIAEDRVPPGGIQGRNDFRKNTYGGPCPPSGTHRYLFKVYALDVMLDLKTGSTKAELERAMQGHILSQGQIIGLYKRS